MTSDAAQQAELPEYYPYFIHTTPKMVWAWDLRGDNLRFLRAIDPGYFEHVVDTYAPLLDGDGAQYAAAAVRVALGQAIETLFALLGALAQAPQCAMGWIIEYQNRQLRDVVTELATPQGLAQVNSWQEGMTIDALSEAVASLSAWPKGEQQFTAESFARLWHFWTRDLLNQSQRDEYNAFKHGSRTGLGGHTLSVGEETTYGEMAPPEAMVPLGGTEFGSSFFTLNRLDNNIHRYPRHQSINWHMPAMLASLKLVATSIRNVTSSLRILGGDDATTCEFRRPTDPASYQLPFSSSGGILSSGFGWNLTAEQIKLFSRHEVLDLLKPADHQATEN